MLTLAVLFYICLIFLKVAFGLIAYSKNHILQLESPRAVPYTAKDYAKYIFTIIRAFSCMSATGFTTYGSGWYRVVLFLI